MIKVEFIESYIKVGNDYQWNDNHGELIRCKDCKHAHKCYGDVVWTTKNGGFKYNPLGTDGFCSMAERKEE